MVLIMAVTHTGNLPVPGSGRSITVMHIPVILGAVLSGPMVGALLGLIFGISNCMDFPPNDWTVQVIPRVMIGLVASVVFLSAKHYAGRESRATVGAAMAALAGSLTNTLGVTMIAAAKGYFSIQDMVGVAFLHGGIEALLAVIITLPVAVSIHHSPDN